MPPRPAGQLAAVDVADLTALVLRRAHERPEAGKAETGLMDAVVLLLLTWEIERDEALAQAEMFRRGMKAALWMAREHFERMDPRPVAHVHGRLSGSTPSASIAPADRLPVCRQVR
jgi:hypothetical protein